MADNLTFRLDVDSSQATQSINNFFQTFEQGAARAKGVLNKEFGQGVQTEVRVEFKNGELVAKKIQSVKQESKQLGDIWNALNGKLGKTPNELKKQSSILKQLRGDTRKYEDGTKRVTKEWQALSQRIKDVDAAQRRMSGQNFLSGFAGRFAAVQTAANLATGAIMGAFRALQDLAGTAIRMETLQLQLEAFANGAEGANAAFDEFVRIAANSPLNLEQVANAGKIMMAFGMDTEAAVKATEQLAIVSAATGGDINLLARNMGQIVAQGRAYTRDLTQFAIQGIPIWKMLSVATGESVSSLKDLAKEGKIGGAEVSAALDLMTAKGTNFYKIAERMQETFQGRLARIEAAFQKLAAEAVKAFNKLDKSLGGIVSGSMKLFADALFTIADNFGTIVTVVASATAGILTFIAASNMSAIVNFIIGAIWHFKLLAAGIWSAVKAQIALLAAMGPKGWATIALAVGVAAGAYALIKGKMDENTASMAQQDAKAAELAGTINNLSDAEMEYAGQLDQWANVKRYERLREDAERYKKQLDAQVAVLERMKDKIEERYEKEKAEIEKTIAQIDKKIKLEEDGYKKLKDEAQAYFDQEKAHLEESLELVREKYGEQIKSLQEMSPKEKELYEFEKAKLKEKIKSGELDKEGLLRAQARLERMERQEKVAKLRKEQAEKEKKIQEEMKTVDEDRKYTMDQLKESHESILQELKDQKTQQEQNLQDAKNLRDEEVKKIDEATGKVKELNTTVDLGTKSVADQIEVVKGLTQQWWNVEEAARKAAAQIREANRQRSSDKEERATGGPVSGGTTYTVNEFGKEAFLSASGKLSMINAPAWGDWRAPANGTVIPAHLTKQLDIPKGGVNLNSAAKASASRAGAGGSNMAGMVRALSASMRGDNISNNVTVQSVNPNKTASDMLVAMTKVRRRRLR